MSHTFAALAISRTAHDEIAALLREAGYDHAFVDGAIDMHGIGLVVDKEAAPTDEPSAPSEAGAPAADLARDFAVWLYGPLTEENEESFHRVVGEILSYQRFAAERSGPAAAFAATFNALAAQAQPVDLSPGDPGDERDG